MELGSGSAEGVGPGGANAVPADAATGYALTVHSAFWQSVGKKRRSALVGKFMARAKAAGTGNTEVAKALVRGFGAEVADFGAAVAILAGYEAYSWSVFSWAGPNSFFVPNQTERPDWLK